MNIFKKHRIYKAIKEKNYRTLCYLVETEKDEKVMLDYALSDAKVNKRHMLSHTMRVAHNKESITNTIKEYRNYALENEDFLITYYYFIADILSNKLMRLKIDKEYIDELENELLSIKDSTLLQYYINKSYDIRFLENLKNKFKEDKEKLVDFLVILSSNDDILCEQTCEDNEYMIFSDGCAEIDKLHSNALVKVKEELGKLVNER